MNVRNGFYISFITILGVSLFIVLFHTTHAQESIAETDFNVIPSPIEIVSVSEALLQSVENNDIEALNNTQEVYFEANDQYKQIPGIINVYETPDGWGYQVENHLSDRIEFIGYGTNAEAYTYTIDFPPVIATSTDESIINI